MWPLSSPCPYQPLPALFSFRSTLNGSSVIFDSTITLTSTSKSLSLATSASEAVPNPASTHQSSTSGSSQGSRSSISLISSSSSAQSSSKFAQSTSDTPFPISPSLAITTVAASNGAPSTVVLTATQPLDTINGATMSSG
jgi:hypothetical protein